jgi:DNA-directed RNA polymerase sigma subunit (sigma70/sigma32)
MHPSITPEIERRIISALEEDAHASWVTRALGDVSYATVWRVAYRNSISLTAGRETMGRRLTPDKRASVIERRQANPDATQLEIARQAGVSRSSVRRIEGNSRRPRSGQIAWRAMVVAAL